MTDICPVGRSFKGPFKDHRLVQSFHTIPDVKHREKLKAVSHSTLTEKRLEKDSKEERWNRVTNEMVQISTFPFLFLSIPQLLQNAFNLSQGHQLALSILSWKGFLTALAGNSILMTYFLKKGEHGAAVVQAIGVMSNYILLLQIFIAGLLPGVLIFGITAFILLSSFVNGSVIVGSSRSWKWLNLPLVVRLWETCLSVLGLSLLAHALWSTVFPNATLMPALVTSIISLVIDIMHWRDKLSSSARNAWNGISAWTATFLFAFQPIGQLVCNFADPAGLSGLSLNTILLGMMGNGLMVPRALRTKDKIWLTGTMWSSLMMGWAQLLCFYVGSITTGSCYLSGWLFYSLTSFVISYFSFVFLMEARICRAKFLLEPLLLTYLGRSL